MTKLTYQVQDCSGVWSKNGNSVVTNKSHFQPMKNPAFKNGICIKNEDIKIWKTESAAKRFIEAQKSVLVGCEKLEIISSDSPRFFKGN